jgi:hypothetical protein
VSRHLSFGSMGKAAWANAMVANPAWAGEIRPSGMKRGAYGNVGYGGTRNPPHTSKECVIRKLSKVARCISIPSRGTGEQLKVWL